MMGNESIGQRLAAFRKSLDLTQAEFSSRLGIKLSTYGKYESEANTPTDAVIKLICKTFNLSEDWVRTGAGEMYLSRTREEEIAFHCASLLRSDDAEGKALLTFVLEMSPEERRLVIDFARRLVESVDSE